MCIRREIRFKPPGVYTDSEASNPYPDAWHPDPSEALHTLHPSPSRTSPASLAGFVFNPRNPLAEHQVGTARPIAPTHQRRRGQDKHHHDREEDQPTLHSLEVNVSRQRQFPKCDARTTNIF